MKHSHKITALILLLFLAAACTVQEDTVTQPTGGGVITGPTTWTGNVADYGYVHSLNKIVTITKLGRKDSVFQDTNLRDAQFSNVFSVIKIGKTFDSLSSGDKLYWTPQNGFIVFDLAKHFGGTISNVRTANFKIKLFQRSEFTSSMKFVVSILDTTILSKTTRERVYLVQNSVGAPNSYLTEMTVDLKDKISPSGKVVVGIKAENADQLFASVAYCKIEFDGDIRR